MARYAPAAKLTPNQCLELIFAAGFSKLAVKQAQQLCDPDLKAVNSKAQPDRIAPKSLAKVKVAGEKIEAVLLPASWNVIQLDA